MMEREITKLIDLHAMEIRRILERAPVNLAWPDNVREQAEYILALANEVEALFTPRSPTEVN